MAKIFYTPPGYTGTAELTASNGLEIVDQGRWRFSQQGYNDGATFGLSIGAPYSTAWYDYGADTRDVSQLYGNNPQYIPPAPYLSGGELYLRARDWPIVIIGNDLTDYDDPTYGFLPADTCRITITGSWWVVRQQNTNSYNSFNINYRGRTVTDQGDRNMDPNLLTLITGDTTYFIQGSSVTGGAQDTFSNHEFFVRVTEESNSTNSNREFQSNTITRPVWVYTYAKSWEISV